MLYDVIIIGSGPAGLTASIYASRYKLSNLVIGKLPGGTITYADKVQNFPGVSEISGVQLGEKMLSQAKVLGGEIVTENVKSLGKNHDVFTVASEYDKEYQSKTLIIASGTGRRKLNIPGEGEYVGKGVSYCTNCDAPFFKNKTVILVGGANSACSGAIHLAEYAQKVYLVYRKSELRAEPIWVEEVKSNPKIEVIYDTNLLEIIGDGSKVTQVKLDKEINREMSLPTDGVFVEIGGIPTSNFLSSLEVEMDKSGYIVVNEEMVTNVQGVFAAGDVTNKSLVLQQTVTACAQGAIAGYSVFKYLKQNKRLTK